MRSFTLHQMLFTLKRNMVWCLCFIIICACICRCRRPTMWRCRRGQTILNCDSPIINMIELWHRRIFSDGKHSKHQAVRFAQTEIFLKIVSRLFNVPNGHINDPIHWAQQHHKRENRLINGYCSHLKMTEKIHNNHSFLYLPDCSPATPPVIT